MFGEFDQIQINYEGLWREAIVESADSEKNSYMVVFDNNNPFLIGAG